MTNQKYRKPPVILAYNEGKGGVDIVDKMIDTYRCKVGTLRWPMVVFYTILDVAALNAFVIWLYKKPNWNESKGTRRWRTFLTELGKALVLPHIEKRACEAICFKAQTQQAIWFMLNRPVDSQPQSTAPATSNKLRKCALCIQSGFGKGYKKAKMNANKVKQCCEKCRKPVCNTYSYKRSGVVCNNCKN